MPMARSQSASSKYELVHLVSVNQVKNVKRVVMQSTQGTYVFSCNSGAYGCTTPLPAKLYFLVRDTSTGKWNLDWLKEWYVEYHDAENIGIVPAWPDWNRSNDFMKDYRLVGAYWLVSFRATR